MNVERRAAIIAIIGLVACSSAEERAESAREEAKTAIERGQRATALEAIAELREVQPESADAVLELTKLLVAAGEAPQAVWVLEEGLARFPDRDDLRTALATAALMTNDATLARKTLHAIPATSDQHAEGLILLARAELELGDLERALAVLDAGAARYPDLPVMRISRISTLIRERRLGDAQSAIAEARTGMNDDALKPIRQLEATLQGLAFAEGIDIAESGPDAVELSAEAKREQVTANRQRALARLLALVAEDPEDLQLWLASTTAHWKAGKAPEAVEHIELRLEEHPEQVGLYPILSRMQSARGKRDEAESAIRAFAETSQSPSGHLALATFQAKEGNDIEALATLDRALEDFPDTELLLHARTETLINLGRLDDAREAVAHFADLAPDAPEVEFLRSLLELADGDAAAAADRLLRLAPRFDNASAQFWLGRALEDIGDRAGAERRYRLAVTRSPQEPVLVRAVLHLAEARGDWPMVISYGQRLLALEPLADDAWQLLLRALVQLGHGEAAEQLARRGAAIIPDSAGLRVGLVRALLVQQRYDEALAEAELATERLGTLPEIEAERALALGMRGDLIAGLAHARNALDEHPESSRLHVAIAALSFERGERTEGSNAIDRALALAPADPTPLRLRAEFMASVGAWESAGSDCERYLEARPDDPKVRYILGVALAGAGRTREAMAAYARAAELDREAWEPRNNLAELQRAQGDLDGALASAQKAFALADGNPYVADTLGWLYLEKGLASRSVGLLEEAHAGIPGHPIVQLHLALAYRANGQSEDSRKLLTKLEVESRPNPTLHAQVQEALHSLD